MMQRIARTILLILTLLIVTTVAACSGIQGQAPAQQVPTSTPIPTAPAVARPTYLVQRGDVQETLEFTGRWQPRDQTLLSFPVSGTVRSVNVKRGDAITTGQLLADFQISNLEDQLASAQLNLQSAKAALTSGTTGTINTVADAEVNLANAQLALQRTKDSSPWPQVQSARIGLDSATQNLANAQRAYDDAISRPSQSASAIDQAYNNLLSAKNQLRSAQSSYDSAAQSFATYKYQIASAENAVIQARLNLDQARTGGADPQKQQAVQSAQLQVDQIKNNIAQSSLKSPSDGEVLEVTIKPGDAVKAYDSVMTIGRQEPKEIVASIAIGDAQRLSVGLIGICEVLNKPETAVQCIVRRLPLSAKDADQSTRIAASLEDLKLITGTLIDVQMPLKVSTNVLWLPPAAVRTFQNRTFVVLQTPDGPRSVDVEVGLRTTDRVELKSGVKEGDVVVGP